MISNSDDLGPVLLYFVLLPTNLDLGQHSVKTVGLGSMWDRLGQLSQGLEAHQELKRGPGMAGKLVKLSQGYRPRAPVSPHVSFSVGSRASRASIPRDRLEAATSFRPHPEGARPHWQHVLPVGQSAHPCLSRRDRTHCSTGSTSAPSGASGPRP